MEEEKDLLKVSPFLTNSHYWQSRSSSFHPDSSSLDNKVGCVYYSLNRTYRYGLPSISSVFPAELFDILKGFNTVHSDFVHYFLY